MPMTNGVRAGCARRGSVGVAVQGADVADVEAEQPRDRQVDVSDLVEVELVAETAQPLDLVGRERERHRLGERGPGSPVQLDVGRLVFSAAHGRHCRVSPCHVPLRACAARQPLWRADFAMGPLGTLGPMCGIVGYVGAQSALDVVIEGLRRLEYRGYDSAGVALVTDGELFTEKRAGKLANLDTALQPSDEPPEVDRPASGTPAGPPTARPTTATRTRTRAASRASPSCTTASSRTSPHCATSSSARATSCAPRPTPRSRPTCSRREVDKGADLTDGDADAYAGGSRAPSRWSRPVSDDPTRVVAARRNSPLVVGIGEGENFLASDVAAFIEHTREAMELGQDQVVTITRDGVQVTDFRGDAGRGQAVPRRLGHRGRREGRLRLLHAQGDRRAAAGDRRHPARPDQRRRPAPARRDAAQRRRAARDRQDHHRRVRHGLPRRPRRQVRDRALDPDPVRGRAGLGVPLPRPDHRPRHDGDRDQPERRDHGHADGAAARPRAARQGARDLQQQRRRRSRASPTRCSTRTPGPRSPSHPPRRS